MAVQCSFEKQSTRPLELVCIDFWSAKDTKNKSIDVLVVTVHFTRLAQAFPPSKLPGSCGTDIFVSMACQSVFTVTKVQPMRADSLSNFSEFQEWVKSHTTPYHPMGNGSVERFNRTLGNMISVLSPDVKRDWPKTFADIDVPVQLHDTRVYELCTLLSDVWKGTSPSS
ncbi:uncharacterized protein LOC113637785 [Tachysurus ichikawai]